MLTPIKPMTLVDQASEQILSYIAENSLQPGDSLPSTAELSARLGASRAVIRESLRSLEAKGIIEVTNGRKARIKPVTHEPLLDFFQRFIQVENRAVWEFSEIRIALELQCASLAAERATDEQLDTLQIIVSQMRGNLKRPKYFAELDMQFHLQIAHATNNTMMVHLLESLRDAIRACIQSGLHKRPSESQMEKTQCCHEALMSALRERKVDQAVTAMRAHFDESAKYFD